MKMEPLNFAQWLEEFGHGATNRAGATDAQVAEVVRMCERDGQRLMERAAEIDKLRKARG